jgi:glycerophosphoryl diester phosphodiesterase
MSDGFPLAWARACPMLAGMPPLILAHRGDMSRETENTLAAFRAAARHGADGVETDVQQSADGVWLLFHDATLARFGCTKRVAELTEAEIRAVAPSDAFPTLGDALAILGPGLELWLEVKPDPFLPFDASSLLEVLAGRPAHLLCFDRAVLRATPLPAVWNVEGIPEEAELIAAKAEGCGWIDAQATRLTQGDAARAKRAGLRLATWGNESPALAGLSLDCGAEVLIGNDPIALRAWAEAWRP